MEQEFRYRALIVAPTLRAQGRSMTWLARQLGFSRQYTSDVAHGNRTCNAETAERMAAVIGLPLFLGFELQKCNDSMHMSKVA